MNKENCVIPGCTNPVVFGFLLIENRQIENSTSYCEQHGQNFLKRYKSSFERQGSGQSRVVDDLGTLFDLELLVYDYREDSRCGVSLRETGGNSRVDLATHRSEIAILGGILRRDPEVGSPIYSTINEIINEFRGHLSCVTIDSNQPTINRCTAKLHIERPNSNTPLVVNTRPSDALALAVTCDVSVFVDNGGTTKPL